MVTLLKKINKYLYPARAYHIYLLNPVTLFYLFIFESVYLKQTWQMFSV